MHRLFLLDGMALVYRAHFAFFRNPIITSKGLNTSAIFGFANTLLDIIENHQATHLAVAFDTSAPTERHKIFPEYKAQRDAMPEELAAAIPYVKRLCRAMGIPVIELDGYEADDTIGTLARRADEDGSYETYMVTPDKDFAQLVSDKTAMWKPGRKGAEFEILRYQDILDKWEIQRPEQVIDILGLWGDASDNIPGVPGIGEKTAKKLIARFDSTETLLESTDQLKGKQKENLINFADQARLSKKLATIIVDAPVDAKLEDMVLDEHHSDDLPALIEELEFKTLGQRLLNRTREGAHIEEAPASQPAQLKNITNSDHSYHFITEEKHVASIVKDLQKADRFCFDLETSSLDPRSCQILGIALSINHGKAVFVEHSIAQPIYQLLTESPATKVGHNLKFDLSVLAMNGFTAAGPFFDTMIVHSLVMAEQKHSMDALAENLLSYQTVKLQDVWEKFLEAQNAAGDEDDLFATAAKKRGKKAIDMLAIPLDQLADYACEDADITMQLAILLTPMLQQSGQQELYDKIEAPLLPVLVAMENEGIRVDTETLEVTGVKLQQRIDQLSANIFEQAGKEFNLNSPKQLGEILFGEMQLVEKPKKTKTGQFVTNEQVLSSLAPKHPICADILNYREAAKLKSTYVDALPNHISETTQRVHTHYHQVMTATGRLASNDPNLQNIPVRSEAGKEIRRAFVPRDENHTLFAADYSQIELRVMAAVAGDESMIEAFKNGLDIHAATAAKVFHVELDDVTRDMRSTAKMVNFGIIYGISAFGLSQRLGIPRAEAKEIIDTYLAQYPAIAAFMEKSVEDARNQGFAETLAGRRRNLRDINSRNGNIRSNAERAAINTPIQGAAADMIKAAMIKVQQILTDGNYRSKLLLQVHDELIIDMHVDELAELKPKIVAAMESAMLLPHEVPAKVETGQGDNWLVAH
ncbi:DNA polymerase I [Persicirhabdus sediminis]|uniref:DNA polymerase I n=1 Tax=Persicirhabdus sediminis TaxID=454144 RepID=A0A8J7MEH1_9BACT|nr:DNA polymerase I [Persicirhabdus sediminis]MBK1790354.1 DNA polymerase I [Persicirhabdus sediminis]